MKYRITRYDNVTSKNIGLMEVEDLRKETFGDPVIISEFDDAKEWKSEFNELVLSESFSRCLLSREKYVEALGKWCTAKSVFIP